MQRIKRALVTGSSRGIGRALALRLAKDGYEVIVHCAGNTDKANETKRLIEESGGRASVIKADLCNTDETVLLASKIGKIDALVLNASLQIKKHWDVIELCEVYDQLNCDFVS